MADRGLTVLVTGASGFVGSHLARALVEEGHDVRAMTRRPEEYDGPGHPVAGDMSDPDSLVAALDGVDAAYYLVHSLASQDFEKQDAEAARAFAVAAARTGVKQIVYLGGLGAEDGELSPHLRSRRQVEGLLAGTGVPVTVLRAAIVVGHGGISWEMTRQLVDNLPVMATPPWAETRTQPIALEDTIRYLVGVLDNEQALDRTFEIGGPDVLTYGEMMRRASVIQNGRDVPIVKVPMLSDRVTRAVTTELSSYWLSLFTDADRMTGRNLVESMGTEVVVTDDTVREVVPFEPMGYDDMVRVALSDRLREVGTL
ncbi:MAG TPA: NAD(P)H-binding protein [Nocardioides sp.]|nr:NAD(P)H-binding protein [Nocardioides sp.]